ncbi:acetyl-coenzyme A transporter 1-domain-containing protein [Dimargaris cristalligena]|uniref:Acetyl-coenzyme A transporter 1-domain-containing protein n=1 Tax=Dimargaris cristalligena TaxID=215637 RepID=A0A4P9ZY83_9FUNG|nr:acetyl-coenzyme A transporter 1-domain-containing protein [Dimargaris cristalligena]|eukprot:RKP38643.1 acetyl-coenzyme A transporter 1-domain-containing protein [Dimargaris cristalligena]
MAHKVDVLSEKVEEDDLPSNFRKDWANILLLVVLYLLQGVPVGLAFGSIPFLLKAKLSYAQIAVFSLASYPYSLKLFWSPIVDSLYFRSFGRRKTWIVPIQLAIGCLCLWLARTIDTYMAQPAEYMTTITLVFFAMVLLSATQDISVDGWALTLLSKENMSYASTCQTIGLNTGYFLSFTVFLAFNSAEFSNKYLRSVPNDVGVLPLSGYLQFWALMYFLVTLWLVLFKSEDNSTEEEFGITETYRTIWDIIKLPHMRSFILIMLCAKIGFVTNEAVTGLKLLEKGIGKEDLALTVLIDFPFQIIFGYYAAQWSRGENPMKPWLYAFIGRLIFAVIGMLVVAYCPDQDTSFGYFVVVVATTVLSSFMSNVQFVSISVFMTNIADPAIGGTYMTLLNTISNFGGTWPKYFILEAVDYFSVSTCSVPNKLGQTFSCLNEEGKQLCASLQGQCLVIQDGYYIVGAVCAVLGSGFFFWFILPEINRLVRIPAHEWHLNGSREESAKEK